MKIVVIGGTGLIGTKLVGKLRLLGHEVVAASPSRGVNAVTGEGLADALEGAEVVVDVSNSPSFENQAVLEFFESSTRHLLAAEAVAGVKHHVALSVVGIDRAPDGGYFRAKLAQEALIETGPIPYTIVRATQFFEFLDAIAYSNTVGETVHLSPALFQPIAAEDVAAALVDVVIGEPVNGMVELAGPESVGMDVLIRRYLSLKGDPRHVVTDVEARYFDMAMTDTLLRPDGESLLGTTRFEAWIGQV